MTFRRTPAGRLAVAAALFSTLGAASACTSSSPDSDPTSASSSTRPRVVVTQPVQPPRTTSPRKGTGLVDDSYLRANADAIGRSLTAYAKANKVSERDAVAKLPKSSFTHAMDMRGIGAVELYVDAGKRPASIYIAHAPYWIQIDLSSTRGSASSISKAHRGTFSAQGKTRVVG